MSNPTIGRIVLYRPTELEQRGCSENRKAIVRAIIPAIVTNVNEDESLNLKVFQDSPVDLHVTNTSQGEGPGQWIWPPMSLAEEEAKGTKEVAEEAGGATKEVAKKKADAKKDTTAPPSGTTEDAPDSAKAQ